MGKKKDIKVLRDGKEVTLGLELGERPSDDMLAQGRKGEKGEEEKAPAVEIPNNVLAGLTVEAISADNRKQYNIADSTKGVVVSKVEAGSTVEGAGIQAGDVIQEVSRQPIKTLDDYKTIVSKIGKEELVVLLVNRRGNNLFIAVNP